MDEALRQVDEVQENYVHRESQQLADAQEQIRWLENDLAYALQDKTDSRWERERILDLENTRNLLVKKVEELHG